VTQIVEYIKIVTGSPKVAYVGHSMGATMMFYLSVRRPDWVA